MIKHCSCEKEEQDQSQATTQKSKLSWYEGFGVIVLNGDAMSLIGEGTVDLDSNVDLDFYFLIGRNGFEIPVITELYKRGSQQFWWIKVNGTLDDPITEHEVLPGLNDTLKRLFPELTEADQ